MKPLHLLIEEGWKPLTIGGESVWPQYDMKSSKAVPGVFVGYLISPDQKRYVGFIMQEFPMTKEATECGSMRLPGDDLPPLEEEEGGEKLPDEADILKSFDARDWARHFAAYVKANPAIPFDEATMTGWFANALMRGYDEARRKESTISREDLVALVAQGWCSPENSHKPMDVELGDAIVKSLFDHLRGRGEVRVR